MTEYIEMTHRKIDLWYGIDQVVIDEESLEAYIMDIDRDREEE
jgi:hypothetical protein